MPVWTVASTGRRPRAALCCGACMRTQHLAVCIGLILAAAAGARTTRAQLPIGTFKSAGQTVTPVSDGWYKNADGTFSLSFGYYNRNGEEVVDIPIGPDNFVNPGPPNQGQPTEFQPRRH